MAAGVEVELEFIDEQVGSGAGPKVFEDPLPDLVKDDEHPE